MKRNMDKSWIKEYFSIPNLLGYFRLLLLPLYLYLYLNAQSVLDYYAAAFVISLSFLSDLIDGKVARKYDMITEFGKILDPVADKITQGVLAISFIFRYPIIKILLGVFLVKEFILGALGLIMMTRGYRMDGAQMHGKICTVVLDVTFLILLLFPSISTGSISFLVAASIIAMVISLTLYLNMYYKVWKSQ